MVHGPCQGHTCAPSTHQLLQGTFSDLQKRLPAQPCRRPCALLPLQLGEHTEQILREELGLSGEEIRRLREVGAI